MVKWKYKVGEEKWVGEMGQGLALRQGLEGDESLELNARVRLWEVFYD